MNNLLESFAFRANNQKNMYTAGPSSLLPSCLEAIGPCFGRNDELYDKAHGYVEKFLCEMTSHKNLISLQGSASIAIEIGLINFCRGNILLVNTGYYSDRIYNILRKNSRSLDLNIDYIPYKDLEYSHQESYDWIVACYTETSCAFKIDVELIKNLCFNYKSKLFLDATASIGLENKHHLADVICYSSCKGLFGLTGACFIAYNDLNIEPREDSLYLDINTHINHAVTGPYHQILSLYGIFKDYDCYVNRVKCWQKCFSEVFRENLIYDEINQPYLCTLLDSRLKYKMENPVPYKPRTNNKGDVVCHIGQVHRDIKSINYELIRSHFEVEN
tara:strand:- start:3583 stop:4575 length:993 start_codon:yes stop_codon:yes gene_type:complete